MNSQIPDYSAVYSNPNLDFCSACQQGMGANASVPQPPALPSFSTSPAGTTTLDLSNLGGMQSSMAPLPPPLMQQREASTTGYVGSMQPVTAAQGGSLAGQPVFSTSGQFTPITDTTRPAAMTMESLEYLNGLLRTQIGRRVRVEFLIGTNTFTDKSGVLIGVGANYILLRETSSDDIIACDFYNIKFITFFY